MQPNTYSPIVARAVTTVHTQLRLLPRRLAHSLAVGRQAENHGYDETVVAAAYLHDIGYGQDLIDTGFHPIDGARYLRAACWSEDIVSMVAFHTGAEYEARSRNLSRELGRFDRPDQNRIDHVTYCDCCTTPTGQLTTPAERINEILSRYPSDHVVHQTIQVSKPYLLECCARARASLAGDMAQIATQPVVEQLTF